MKRLISIEEKKKIMLRMMDYIDKFCKENKIRYFLYGGTLIGAIRHKGYIPWDDDIDICMLREDFDRFISTFHDTEGRYRVISSENMKYYIATPKVIDCNTVLYENVANGTEIGVFIDVFPLDSCFDDFTLAERYANIIGKYRNVVTIKNLLFTKDRSAVKNFALLLAKIGVLFIPRRYAIKKIEELSKKYKYKETKYVGQFTTMTYGSREIYERVWFSNTIDVPFEDSFFSAPKDYNNVLKTEFGNYMKLPPKEKQITHHSNEAWWRE